MMVAATYYFIYISDFILGIKIFSTFKKNQTMKKTFILISALVCAFTNSSKAQTISTIAGTGVKSFSGDSGPATAADIHAPWGVATDASGNVYFTDYYNYRVRKISTSGIISTIAGTGTPGFSGDGGPATLAQFESVAGVCVDKTGNIYISENLGHRIRKIDVGGIITTVAGNGTAGSTGDGGPAIIAEISNPNEVFVDGTGNVYIPDQGGRVRKVNTSGIISTIAGTGVGGYSGDGGPATLAKISLPNDVYVDAAGNVYFAEYINNVIRKVNTSGIISTIAGTSVGGYSGDGGPATAAKLKGPAGVDMIGGEIIFCDAENSVIRKINATGIISTIAGTGVKTYTGDGGPATAYALNRPNKSAHDAAGNIYIADIDNDRIRKITSANNLPAFLDGTTKPLMLCQGSSVNYSSLVSVSDVDVAQTETWSTGTAPSHGTIISSYSAVSTGGTLTPVGLTYTPVSTFAGLDTFVIQLSDGTSTIFDTIYVTVNVKPDAGIIKGYDSVCAGASKTFSDAMAGGTWSSSNSTIATIDPSTGKATGKAAGIDTINYIVINDNGCRDTASFTVKVKAKSGCVDVVEKIASPYADDITVYPNPSTGAFSLLISSYSNKDASMAIYNIAGFKIMTAQVMTNVKKDIQLDVPAGIYLLQISTDQGIITRKLVFGVQ